MPRKVLLPWLIAAAVLVLVEFTFTLDVPTGDDAQTAADNTRQVIARLDLQFQGRYHTVKHTPHHGWGELFIYGVTDASLGSAMLKEIAALPLKRPLTVEFIRQRFGSQTEDVLQKEALE